MARQVTPEDKKAKSPRRSPRKVLVVDPAPMAMRSRPTFGAADRFAETLLDRERRPPQTGGPKVDESRTPLGSTKRGCVHAAQGFHWPAGSPLPFIVLRSASETFAAVARGNAPRETSLECFW